MPFGPASRLVSWSRAAVNEASCWSGADGFGLGDEGDGGGMSRLGEWQREIHQIVYLRKRLASPQGIESIEHRTVVYFHRSYVSKHGKVLNLFGLINLIAIAVRRLERDLHDKYRVALVIQ